MEKHVRQTKVKKGHLVEQAILGYIRISHHDNHPFFERNGVTSRI